MRSAANRAVALLLAVFLLLTTLPVVSPEGIVANGQYVSAATMEETAPEGTADTIAEEEATPKDTAGYAVTVAADIAFGTVTADKVSAVAGEQITLNVTPYESYYTYTVTVNGQEVCPDEAGGYSFAMPAENVEVSASFLYDYMGGSIGGGWFTPPSEAEQPETTTGFYLENALYGDCDLVVGESLTLAPANLPEGAAAEEVAYVSSDESVVRIQSGTAVAIAQGTATVTATVTGTDGTPQTAQLVIHTQPVPTMVMGSVGVTYSGPGSTNAVNSANLTQAAKDIAPDGTLTASSGVVTENYDGSDHVVGNNNFTFNLSNTKFMGRVAVKMNNNSTMTITGSGSFGLLEVEGGNVVLNGNFTITEQIFVYGGTLTLQSGTVTCKYTGAYPTVVVGSDGGAKFVIAGGKLTTPADAPAARAVFNYGTFEMSGGEISGFCSRDEEAIWCAAGVSNNAKGTFNMTGGTISGNNGQGQVAGGVYNAGTFNMSGTAKITNNTCEQYGAGIYNCGTATISGGEITNNAAGSRGGGIYAAGSIPLTITGGTIQGNSAGSGGGGVYADVGITLSGSPSIRNNIVVCKIQIINKNQALYKLKPSLFLRPQFPCLANDFYNYRL